MLNKLLNSPVFAATVAGLTVGLLLTVFLLAKTVTEVKNWVDGNNMYPSKTITINGSGEEKAVPDIATFNFSVTEKGDTMEQAQTKATDKTNKAVDYLKSNNVLEKDIQTSGYNTNPVYDYSRPCTAFDCPPYTNKIIGYESSQTIVVKVRQKDEAGKYIAELGRIGVSNISGLSFTIDDENSIKERAKEKAIIDAKEKAKKLANTLGVKLGKIVSFGEDQPYGQYDMMGASVKTMSSEIIAPQLPVGENTFKSSVWVTYEIK